jgi:hypothetical protein
VEPKPEIFVSQASTIGYPNSMTYFVRTATDPLSLLPAVKEKIREGDKIRPSPASRPLINSSSGRSASDDSISCCSLPLPRWR